MILSLNFPNNTQNSSRDEEFRPLTFTFLDDSLAVTECVTELKNSQITFLLRSIKSNLLKTSNCLKYCILIAPSCPYIYFQKEPSFSWFHWPLMIVQMIFKFNRRQVLWKKYPTWIERLVAVFGESDVPNSSGLGIELIKNLVD